MHIIELGLYKQARDGVQKEPQIISIYLESLLISVNKVLYYIHVGIMNFDSFIQKLLLQANK